MLEISKETFLTNSFQKSKKCRSDKISLLLNLNSKAAQHSGGFFNWWAELVVLCFAFY